MAHHLVILLVLGAADSEDFLNGACLEGIELSRQMGILFKSNRLVRRRISVCSSPPPVRDVSVGDVPEPSSKCGHGISRPNAPVYKINGYLPMAMAAD